MDKRGPCDSVGQAEAVHTYGAGVCREGGPSRRQKEGRSAQAYWPDLCSTVRHLLSRFSSTITTTQLVVMVRASLQVRAKHSGKWGPSREVGLGPGLGSPVSREQKKEVKPQVWMTDWGQDRTQQGSERRLHGGDRDHPAGALHRGSQHWATRLLYSEVSIQGLYVKVPLATTVKGLQGRGPGDIRPLLQKATSITNIPCLVGSDLGQRRKQLDQAFRFAHILITCLPMLRGCYRKLMYQWSRWDVTMPRNQ